MFLVSYILGISFFIFSLSVVCLVFTLRRVLAHHDYDAAVSLAPSRKHNRLPDLEVVGLAQRGSPGAEPLVPLARRAERLVRDQPLAVQLVQRAHRSVEDDGAGLAARGRPRRVLSVFVTSRG